MKKLQFEKGERFGKLTILGENPIRKNNNVCWDCLCDCGNIVTVRGNRLKNGQTRSCGCGKRGGSHKKILSGEKFGNLTVLDPTEKRTSGGAIIYKCQCDCGNIVEVPSSSLRTGNTKTCGKHHLIDLTGLKFGHLTVLKRDYSKQWNQNQVMWECQCDCGNKIITSSQHLRTGHTTSCGCIKSKGEEAIGMLLKNHRINFIKEKSFKTCRQEKTTPYRFDFYVDNKYLIEFDGIQHFEFKNSGWDNEQEFIKRKQRDEFKNQWCRENNIPLIRIPYWHLNDLCIDDLKLEASKFIIKN